MFGTGLVVSLPGSLVSRLALPGSVFAFADIRDAVMPTTLRSAIALVMHAAAESGTPVQFVARPEIFTHGASRAWLDAKIGGASDHVALSDGTTFKVIPGLRNHLFFYARGSLAGDEALRWLVRVAPEMFVANCASQINGSLAIRAGNGAVRPPTTYLRFPQTPPGPPPRLLPFYCNPGSPEDSAMRCLEVAGMEDEDQPLDGRPVCHIPLTETALADRLFARAVALRVLDSLFGKGDLVLLELPALDRRDAEVADQIALVVRALAATGLLFPRVLTRAALFATAPPSPHLLAGGSMLLHPGVPFWRYGLDHYQAARQLDVAGSVAMTRFRMMLGEWLGRDVEPVPANAILANPRVSSGGAL